MPGNKKSGRLIDRIFSFKRRAGLKDLDFRIVVKPIRLENVVPDCVRHIRGEPLVLVAVSAELALNPDIHPDYVLPLLIEVELRIEKHVEQFAQPVLYLVF